MRIKNGFELKEICGENIVIAHGLDNIDFSKVISLNETAAYLWRCVEGKEFTADDLAAKIREEYEVDEATAIADVKELVKTWIETGLVE